MSRNKKQKLNDKQLMAVEILSTPGRHGMTYKEITEHLGIAETTIHNWRKKDYFNDAVKEAIIRKSVDDLPEIVSSFKDHAIGGNAQFAKLVIEMHGMLTAKQELTVKDGQEADVDDIKAKLAEMGLGDAEEDDKAQE